MRNTISKIQYILVACLLLFSSGSSTVSTNKVWIISWCIFSVIYLLFTQIRASKQIILVLGTLFGVAYIYYLINNTVDQQTYLGYFAYIIGTFSTVKIAGKMLPKITINVVYFAALVSLPLYVFQLIAPDQLFEINNLFSLESRGNSNSIIFNFTYLHANRNCGFMWEPGAFAGLLIVCLYINLVIIQNYKLFTRTNIVFLAAILTTLSTLGYLTLLLPLLAAVVHRRQYKYLVSILIALPLLANLNFLLPKLFNETNNVNNELSKTQHATEESQVSVSRSTSIAIDFSSFSKRPLLGYGIDFRTTNAKQIFNEYDKNVIRSSGLMNLLLRFGLIGFFVYSYLIFRSLRFYTSKSSAIIFSLLVIMVLFSNPLDNSPFLFSLFFWQPFNQKMYVGNPSSIRHQAVVAQLSKTEEITL